MILTDQLIIEDRKKVWRCRQQPGSHLSYPNHRKYIMSSATAWRECTPERCQFLMVNTIALFHAMMTKILTLAIFHQIIKIIVWTKTKPDLFPGLTLRTFLMTPPGDGQQSVRGWRDSVYYFQLSSQGGGGGLGWVGPLTSCPLAARCQPGSAQLNIFCKT